MAPLPVSFAVKVIDRVAHSPFSGILQASGNQDVTYEEAARFCATTLGFDPTLVQPVKIVLGDQYTEPILGHTTMDNNRLKSDLGMDPPDVWQTLREVFLEMGTPAGRGAGLAIKGATQ